MKYRVIKQIKLIAPITILNLLIIRERIIYDTL